MHSGLLSPAVTVNDNMKFRGTTILSLGSDVSEHIELGLASGDGNNEYVMAYTPGENLVDGTAR